VLRNQIPGKKGGIRLANSKSIGCGGVVVVLIGAAIVASWFNGGDTGGSPESISESQAGETFQSFGCLEVSETLVDSIAQGFDSSTLTGRAAGFLASQYADVKFVAVEFVPDGLSDPEVAVFATNDDDLGDLSLNGLIISVDAFAKNFSDWGDAPNLELSIADEGVEESKECLGLPGFKLSDGPATPDGFDEAAFLETAKSMYGVVDETFEDGSTLTVMQLAWTACSGNLSTMRENLGGQWETSFAKFAVESLCPEQLE
jgi:hypothetical protein